MMERLGFGRRSRKRLMRCFHDSRAHVTFTNTLDGGALVECTCGASMRIDRTAEIYTKDFRAYVQRIFKPKIIAAN